MDLALFGKVAIVTGASRGIGAAIARELAAEGCDVALGGRDAAALEAVASDCRELGRRALIHPADLREPKAPALFAEKAKAELGRVDVVVCNAGATKRGDFLALTDDEWADGFALKLFAHARLLRAAWPALVESKGSALIISGAGGRTPGAEFTIGGSVNAALLSLTKALAARTDGVQVNAVSPGAIRTERLQARIQSMGSQEKLIASLGISRLGEPRDIAALVAFVVSPRGRYLHGALIDADGGLTKTI